MEECSSEADAPTLFDSRVHEHGADPGDGHVGGHERPTHEAEHLEDEHRDEEVQAELAAKGIPGGSVAVHRHRSTFLAPPSRIHDSTHGSNRPPLRFAKNVADMSQRGPAMRVAGIDATKGPIETSPV
jgi:hypothetical protein